MMTIGTYLGSSRGCKAWGSPLQGAPVHPKISGRYLGHKGLSTLQLWGLCIEPLGPLGLSELRLRGYLETELQGLS